MECICFQTESLPEQLLVYSTYLGGSGEDGSTIDGNYALIQVAVDTTGEPTWLALPDRQTFL